MGKKGNIKIRTENDTPESENESLTESEPERKAPAGTDDRAADLETRLETAQKEAEETHARLLRVAADFENYKKRSTREMEDFRKFANESLIKALLPVVDNLERALDSVNNNRNDNDSFVKGIQMTLSEIWKIFEKFHVKPVESLEKPFDPCFHQAMMQEAADHCPDKTVLKELQKGYLMHDKLIRPAMVVVSKKNETIENQKDDEQLEEQS